jgi:organic hydroperoxide reductase OsmC/OhrA
MADNSDLTFEELSAEGTLRLRPDDGDTVVDSFDLEVTLHGANDNRRADVTLDRAQQFCFLLDSVDFPVTVDASVVE